MRMFCICLELQRVFVFWGLCAARGELGKYKENLFFVPGGKSLSAAFTQTRLLRPECVSAGILMLTYLSTLRLKSRRFLFRAQNAYFANSPNTSHRPRFALASLRKATPRPAFDGELRKAIKAKNSGSCEKGSVVLGWSVQRVVSARCFYWWYQAETDFDQSESVLWHLRVAEGDHLSERSE